MQACFKCGTTGEKTILMEAIIDKGIVKICQKCARGEDIPIIRKPSLLRIEEVDRKESVYERMQKVSGVSHERDLVKQGEVERQDKSLREIVDKNFKSNFRRADSHNDLIENFHWNVMRARRLKKLTIEQFANKINESAEAIRMLEKGFLPQNYSGLIKKIEDALGIRLFREEFVKKERAIEIVPSEALGKPEEFFEENNSRILTVSDLKTMRNTYEDGILNTNENSPEFIEVKDFNPEEADLSLEEVDKVLAEEVEASRKIPRFKNLFKRKEKEKTEEDLGQEEIDKILFRR